MNAKQFMYFEQVLGAISTKLCSHDEQFVKIDKRFIEMDQKIGNMQFTMNKRMDKMDQRMDMMDQQFNELRSTMKSEFAKLLNTPEQGVTDIKLDVYETKQRLSIVEANAIVLNQEVDSGKAKLKRMETRLEEVTA